MLQGYGDILIHLMRTVPAVLDGVLPLLMVGGGITLVLMVFRMLRGGL